MTHLRSPLARNLRASFALLALAAAVSCKKADDATGATDNLPDQIVIVQGNEQIIQAGKDLPTQIVLRVVNKDGIGVSGVTVSLQVATGGGAVTPASDSTNTRGEIKAKWTLGPGVSDQALLASVPGLAPVPVRATGLLPTDVIIVQGNGQSAKAGGALTNSIIVRVVSSNNVPMVGVNVGFQVLVGGGAMAPQTAVTNAFGEATTKWTMGTVVGPNSAQVIVGSLSPVTLLATGT